MASKRQRKKNQSKQNISLLQLVGITDKQTVKQLKNKPDVVKKVYKKEKRKIDRNATANERSEFMQHVLGLKMNKENQSKRYWGKARWEEWKAEQLAELEKKRKKEERERKKKERKIKDDNDLYLLMFWKEKTNGFADEDIIEDFKYQYRHLPNQYLIDSINGFLTSPDPLPSLIGTTHIAVVKGSQRKSYIQFMKHFDEGGLSDMTDWMLVYEGKADLRRYHELLLSIHTIIRLLYDASEKADFVGNLISKYLPQVNKKTAMRLAKDLNFRRF